MACNIEDEVVDDTCIGLIEGRKEFVDTFENDDKHLL